MTIRLLLLAVLAQACYAPSTNSPAPSASPPLSANVATPGSMSGVLGHQLGGANLSDLEADAIATLGQPSSRTITHGIGTPQWEYANGYVLSFAGTPSRVWQIYVRPPRSATTSEGFTLGDTDVSFRALYSGFLIQDFVVQGRLQLQIATPTEVLIAGFGPDRKSEFVLLRTEPGPP